MDHRSAIHAAISEASQPVQPGDICRRRGNWLEPLHAPARRAAQASDAPAVGLADDLVPRRMKMAAAGQNGGTPAFVPIQRGSRLSVHPGLTLLLGGPEFIEDESVSLFVVCRDLKSRQFPTRSMAVLRHRFAPYGLCPGLPDILPLIPF